MDKSKQPLRRSVAHQRQPDLGRRRFTRAGAGAGAIVATLTSRPVLAGICKSPSGFASGNLSHPGMIDCGAGLSPEEWIGNLPDGTIKFHDLFSQGDRADWGGAKLDNVLSADDNQNTPKKPNPISKEFVAALFNIRGGSYPAGLTEVQLMHMWDEWVSTGEYQVQPGVVWTADEHIVPYLRSLHS